ncbi:hypothetical protein MWMV17_MWMV17_02308 [Acinetobacter calcoaceticus]|uniref:Preprotein translocase subunit SecG n=1 Tax=Acinetobacter calcoaceticus DSM 30006 = CIP 81.8 TaxID=981331 RepID=A0ABN0K8A0_ACICA|nr:hypothetical protein F936_02842 [Acinetobacter calcoaceticus DSM 30006 = CIP 81.8]CAI3143426.1 hypothetical protein MWMV17_MWMV17_02308 [Acinetobacter calcoaceticus]SUU52939.1 Uncharacterised protein [Acinetobacter calcoaceticus]
MSMLIGMFLLVIIILAILSILKKGESKGGEWKA